MIVWLASYPRSGNTYFRVLLKQYYGIQTNSIHQIRQEAFEGDQTEQLELVSDIPATLDELINDPAHRIVKTHELPSDEFPAIYLVRDGRDALVSHAHYHLEYDLKLEPEAQQARFEDTLRMLIETDVSYGGWSGNIHAWTTRTAPTAVVKYENLITQPNETVQAALTALHYPTPPMISQETSSFDDLHRMQPQFFRKGKAGGWREEMSPELHELFWERHGATMQTLGYHREASRFRRLQNRFKPNP